MPEKEPQLIAFPDISQEIVGMFEKDQAMRARNETDPEFWDESIDQRHTERMKEIVAAIGWPTVSKVGKNAAHSAWLLVQHADRDVGFQDHCLTLMKEAGPDEVDSIDRAYLEDRVRVNQGKGQLYGTQFRQEGGKHVCRPIEDEARVDERRREVGMGPLSEQIEKMYQKYPFTQTKK